MLKQVKNLLTVFDKKIRVRYYSILSFSLLSPLLDLFGFSMVIPVLLSASEDERAASKKLLLLGILMLAKGVYDVFMVRLQASWQSDCNHILSTRIFGLLLHEDLDAHNARSAGQVLQQTRSDVGTALLILVNFKYLLVNALLFLGCAVLIVIVSGPLGTAAFAVLGLLLIFLFRMTRGRMLRLGAEKRQQEIGLSGMVVNTYHSYKEAAIDRRKQNLVDSFSLLSERKEKTIKSYLFFQSFSSTILQNITQAVVFFVLAAILTMGFEIGVWASTLVLVFTFISRMLPAARMIVSSLNEIRYSSDAYRSVMSNCREIEEIEAKKALRSGLRQRQLTLSRGITLTNVTFAYEDGPLIFKDLNMEIPVGRFVAVIGKSGSGKTTLLDLIVSLIKPQSGAIRYDDYDIVSESDTEGPCVGDLGQLVSYMPQSLSFQDDTIRNLVAFMAEPGTMDDERIRDCLKSAMLYEDVMALPSGLDTLIGSGGVRLSGGQYQRLGLARALYKDFSLMIMDEGTAALDTEVEEAVFRSLRSLGADKTLLLVTHHRELAERCDIIYEIQIQSKSVVRIK